MERTKPVGICIDDGKRQVVNVVTWEQRKLGDVIIDAYQGINTTADKVIYSNEGIPVLQAKHITAGSIDFTDVRYLKKEQYNEYFPKYTPQKGDMLFANIGTIGPSTIVENQGEFLIAWNILRIVFNKNLVDAYFVHLIFDKYKDSGYFERMQTGNATKFINKDNIFDINLFMPSEVEQHKIGGYFQNLDHLITLHQRKCDEMKKMKKFMLQKMFPKNGQKNPEIRFDGFTDDWEQRKFSDVVEIGSGMDYKHLGEGDIPVYGTGGYMLSVDSALSEEKDAIGIGRKGTIDKPYILRAPFWTVDTLFYCIPKENHDLDFINCLFQTVDWKKKDESTGVPSLSKVIINNVEAVVPSFDEQKKIGEYFNNLDHLITLHQRKCNWLKKLKEYMLKNIFQRYK